MPLRLDPARHDEKQVLDNLLQLYLHEMCQHRPLELNDEGRFTYQDLQTYWQEAGKFPFFIRLRGRLAGFVLVRSLDTIAKTPTYSIADFFVVESYRRLGIGEEIARTVFDQFPGRWQIGIEASHNSAMQFWRSVLYRYTGDNFKEKSEAGWNGPVFDFASPGARPKNPAAEPANGFNPAPNTSPEHS